MNGNRTDKSGNSDEDWHRWLVNFLVQEGLTSQFYWCLNPNSHDTGGIICNTYDPRDMNSWPYRGGQTPVDAAKIKLLSNRQDVGLHRGQFQPSNFTRQDDTLLLGRFNEDPATKLP